MTNITLTSDLSGLLARVEVATADDQWGLIREAGKLLIPLDPWRAQLNALCDAGGFTDAALALCERVLPGWLRGLDERQYESGPSFWLADLVPPGGTEDFGATAKTPALALLAAMLKALIAQGKAGTAEPLSRSGRK